MSSAAPQVPPHRYGLSGNHDSGRSNGSSFPDRPEKSARALPNIKDLIHRAEATIEEGRYASIERLLDIADRSLRQSLFYLELGRPDTAYVEYVIAYEIFSDVIPKSKDAPSIYDNNHLTEKQRRLRKRLEAQEDRYADVRDSIKADNARHNTQPTFTAELSHKGSHTAHVSNGVSDWRPSSLQSNHSKQNAGKQASSVQRYSYPVTPTGEQGPSHHAQSSPRSPEPYSSHPTYDSAKENGQTFLSLDSSLSDRFAKLRSASNGQSASHQSHQASNSMASRHPAGHVDYTTKRDAPLLHMSAGTSSASTGRQKAGPPVNTTFPSSLPKQPSPAYTPTRGSQDGARFQPARAVRSNGHSEHERSPSLTSYKSSARPISTGSTHRTFFDDNDEDDERNDHPASPGHTQFRRRRSMHKPQETDINAQKLFDYLSTFNVLLIDARPRSDFDSGHIYHRQIMCVEPTALRPSMSAEQLQEALVLSPEVEQASFQQRNQFDLVVYYDQSSDISDWGSRSEKEPNLSLSYLNDALLDFNQEKPLQWPPIILNGGLDAWIELLGPQGLVSSDTLNKTPAKKPLARRAVPTEIHRLDIGKRRHREYNPLDQEELNKWKARARSASVMLDQRPPVVTEQPHENGDDGIISLPTYEDFASRFPDVATVEGTRASETQAQLSDIPEYPTPAPPTAPPPALPPQAVQDPTLPPPIPARPPPSLPRRTYSGVGDRLPQSAAPARPPKLAEYIAPRFRRLPTTGLHNFGVTCYMNATVQCMSATTPLTAFLLETNNIKGKFEEENWKGTSGILGELYYILLRNLWETTDADTIRPTNFRKYCARLNGVWGSDKQQDAKEFLEFLIDGLHEDLNLNWRRNPLRPLNDEEEAHRERMPKLLVAKTEWNRSTHRDYSKLTDIFAGQHMSQLQCSVCKHSSTTYEPFYSMSIEIPKMSKKSLNIYDCLSSYCSAETLSGDEVWNCPHCKRQREATKRITVTRVPETLVIHFKRFSVTRSQSARKITTAIDFPLENLDLGPYVLPQPNATESAQIQQKYGLSALEAPASMQPPYRYNCYAVMRHLGGTIASGHYIALVKDDARQCWRKFDDSRVTNFQPDKLSRSEKLQNEQAYILFYKRITS